MFELGTPWWQIVVRTLAVYGAVLIGLRLVGKRQLGQMDAQVLRGRRKVRRLRQLRKR